MAEVKAYNVNFAVVEHIGKICYYIVNALSCNKLFCGLHDRVAIAERVAMAVEYLYAHLCHLGVLFKQVFLCEKRVLVCL